MTFAHPLPPGSVPPPPELSRSDPRPLPRGKGWSSSARTSRSQAWPGSVETRGATTAQTARTTDGHDEMTSRRPWKDSAGGPKTIASLRAGAATAAANEATTVCFVLFLPLRGGGRPLFPQRTWMCCRWLKRVCTPCTFIRPWFSTACTCSLNPAPHRATAGPPAGAAPAPAAATLSISPSAKERCASPPPRALAFAGEVEAVVAVDVLPLLSPPPPSRLPPFLLSSTAASFTLRECLSPSSLSSGSSGSSSLSCGCSVGGLLSSGGGRVHCEDWQRGRGEHRETKEEEEERGSSPVDVMAVGCCIERGRCGSEWRYIVGG